jgi:hypothetical protein
MNLSTKIKNTINALLEPANIRLETLTADRLETRRLLELEKSGQYRRPIFPVLPQFSECDPTPLFQVIEHFKTRTSAFADPGNGGNYTFANDYFTSPDAEVAYAMVRINKPRCIIEVGSGNSTALFRAAIRDGNLATDILSIDPSPRINVKSLADRIIQQRVEKTPPPAIIDALHEGDILFIDSSHEIRSGNDVVHLLLNVVPSLRKGVFIHIHDIFLPFDYPANWMIENQFPWNEQYLVQGLLQGSGEFEVLWPGHFLQRTRPEFRSYFDAQQQNATSLWLKKKT